MTHATNNTTKTLPFSNHTFSYSREKAYNPTKFLYKLSKEEHVYDLVALGSILFRAGAAAEDVEEVLDIVYDVILPHINSADVLYGNMDYVVRVSNHVTNNLVTNRTFNNLQLAFYSNDGENTLVGQHAFSILR